MFLNKLFEMCLTDTHFSQLTFNIFPRKKKRNCKLNYF